MAILANVEVKIWVNGRTAREYRDEDIADNSHPNTISRYIEGISGAPFAIDIRYFKRFKFGEANYLHCDISCDGELREAVALFKETNARYEGRQTVHSKMSIREEDSWKEFDLCFGDIVTRPDPAQCQKVKEDFGSIKVKIYRHIALPEDIEPYSNPKCKNDAISEKMLKGRALSIRTNLSNGIPSSAPAFFRMRKYDEAPVAVFCFKYRSRKDLQDLLIIHRSPTPIPLEERPESELSLEEARELVRRHRAGQQSIKIEGQNQQGIKIEGQKQPLLKRERSASSENTLPETKRQETCESDDEVQFVRAKSRTMDAEIEVVDLT
ncbi:MAG: hypothetical protein Q9227_004868 [Pyrenula ochraceoflavens]